MLEVLCYCVPERSEQMTAQHLFIDDVDRGVTERPPPSIGPQREDQLQ